jgi:hypothetical protein
MVDGGAMMTKEVLILIMIVTGTIATVMKRMTGTTKGLPVSHKGRGGSAKATRVRVLFIVLMNSM